MPSMVSSAKAPPSPSRSVAASRCALPLAALVPLLAWAAASLVFARPSHAAPAEPRLVAQSHPAAAKPAASVARRRASNPRARATRATRASRPRAHAARAPMPGVAALRVAFDPVTGALALPAPGQLRDLGAEDLERTREPIRLERNSDGSATAYLGDRYLSSWVAVFDSAGGMHTVCVSGAEAARRALPGRPVAPAAPAATER